jgi:hypothetical protein
MKNCPTDMIECAAGYQAEISVHSELDVSTRVYPTKEKCKERTEFIAKRLGWLIEWSE